MQMIAGLEQAKMEVTTSSTTAVTTSTTCSLGFSAEANSPALVATIDCHLDHDLSHYIYIIYIYVFFNISTVINRYAPDYVNHPCGLKPPP